MSLPAVSLDDLDWAALTAAARARIPAASGGRWTLHAPVDPGVTLLELYAALLEQRLYWMDQTPDAMLRGGLALLGEAPKDAAVAATVLYFPTGDRTVAAATAMQLQDSEPPVVFTTEGATRLLPLVSAGLRPRIDLRVGNREHGPDLQAAKPVCLFEDTDEVTVTLWLSSAITPGADGTLLVLLDQPHVPPAWSAEAVEGSRQPPGSRGSTRRRETRARACPICRTARSGCAGPGSCASPSRRTGHPARPTPARCRSCCG
jgi:hypothetical protein